MRNFNSGFTLVEMAVVLVIVGLLLGGLIVPISAQIDQRDYSDAERQLEDIQEALMGYAVVNGSLPCPDTTGDGVMDACVAGSTSSYGGNIPWVTLGIQPTDPWGQYYQYRVNGAFTTAFTLSTSGSGAGKINVYADSTQATLLASNIPAVVYTSGKNGAMQPPASANELENTTDTTSVKYDGNFVSHDFSNILNNEFDDVIVWLSPNVLFNRMVMAGKLP